MLKTPPPTVKSKQKPQRVQPLTRVDLAAAVAAATNTTRAAALAALNAAVAAIKRAVAAGKTVQIRGFATIASRRVAARMRRNPRTGATVPKPARTVPCLRASKAWKIGGDK